MNPPRHPNTPQVPINQEPINQPTPQIHNNNHSPLYPPHSQQMYYGLPHYHFGIGQQHLDPRLVPLPPTIVAKPQNQIPSVASFSSASTMSSHQSQLQQQHHSVQYNQSNTNFDMLMQTLLDNQKQMQQMHHQLMQLQLERSMHHQHLQQVLPPQMNIPHQYPTLTPPVPLQNQSLQALFYQQMLEASKAQQEFFQKTEMSSSIKFPKFSGKSSADFTSWYEQILSIIAIPPWQQLYDSATNDVVDESQAPTVLSQKLYSSLQVCMQGEAQTIMRDKTHLRGKSISYLKTLKSIFKHKLTKVELISKEVEYNSLFRKTDE